MSCRSIRNASQGPAVGDAAADSFEFESVHPERGGGGRERAQREGDNQRIMN